LLEELTQNAWPALRTQLFDGWVLNFSEGYTRRANSVVPLYPSSLPLLEKLAVCEAAYAARGQDTVFKLHSYADASLDSLLASRGYSHDGLSSVQECTSLPSFADPSVELSTTLDRPWLEALWHLAAVPAHFHQPAAALLRKIAPPHAFGLILQDDLPVALGLAVAERGYVSLWDIVVSSEHRNQGLGQRLCSSLLAWGATHGATRGFLAVMCDNAPALHLYDRMGFREVYQYWYRVRGYDSR
jgi:ribosomal protein S18 acetylase RimI-like enzyme